LLSNGITVVARQRLGSDHMGTPTNTNARIEQKQRNGVFYAVRAKMLQSGSEGQLVGESVSELFREMLGRSRCQLLL
jgi:hypothetical protein